MLAAHPRAWQLEQERGHSVSMPRGRPGLIHAWPDLTFGETINPAAQRPCGRLWAPRNCATNVAREPTPMGQRDLHSTAAMCTSASPARCPSGTYPGRSSAERCTRTPPRVAAQQRPPLHRASRSPHDRQRRHRAVSVAPAHQAPSRGRAPRLDLRARGTAAAVDCRRLGPVGLRSTVSGPPVKGKVLGASCVTRVRAERNEKDQHGCSRRHERPTVRTGPA
jgi:hypothetical protein